MSGDGRLDVSLFLVDGVSRLTQFNGGQSLARNSNINRIRLALHIVIGGRNKDFLGNCYLVVGQRIVPCDIIGNDLAVACVGVVGGNNQAGCQELVACGVVGLVGCAADDYR